MGTDAAKKAAYGVLKEYRLTEVTLDNLVYLLETDGYDIIDYSRTSNNESTQELLDAFGLTALASQNSAFLYSQGDARYVFLDEDLPTEEKRYALAHEYGHIRLGHTEKDVFLHGTFQQEHEANEFAHYILAPSVPIRTWAWMLGHKVIAILALIAVLAGGVMYPVATYIESRTYHGGYYATPNGTHYHVEGCRYIEGREHRELMAEELDEGNFLPCSVCIES